MPTPSELTAVTVTISMGTAGVAPESGHGRSLVTFSWLVDTSVQPNKPFGWEDLAQCVCSSPTCVSFWALDFCQVWCP